MLRASRWAVAAAAVCADFLALATAAPAAAGNCTEVVPGQYLGTPFNNSLELLNPLSERAWFKIRDPTGQHLCDDDPDADLSLLTFSSLNSTGQRPPNDAVRRLIIVSHGARRDPNDYHNQMMVALSLVDDPAISPDSVVVISPYFPMEYDVGVGYPDPTDPAVASRALVWYFDRWVGGANNRYPIGANVVSSYDALDQIIQWYADKTRFPNLEQVVVAGHSMGAMLVQRYAAVGKTPAQLGFPDTPVTYYVGNPNSMLWFADDRPLSTGNCTETWDNWREGLSNYLPYDTEHSGEMLYNTELVAAGRDAVLANYDAKSIAYGRATRDRGDFKDIYDCAVYTTGKDRSERFFESFKRFPATCRDPSEPGCHTLDIVVSGHSSETMFQSEAGRTRLFLDNWSGDKSRSHDFGYPRIQAGDDPFPDPAHAGEPLVEVDTTAYAGGMAWRGCWTDVDEAQTEPTFPDAPLYKGDLLSREYCAETCAAANFTIAGLNGSKCYCGDVLGSQAVNVVSTSCSLVCPGDANQTCGGPSRLTVLASVDLVT
ncbi:putative carbohydrate-binding wsc protein [Eutypa lata UCREL1]|uniref:Putative carbohydrate-binding wsc protein n=1 Tax=Eutypa lata (strain UCR-EL1) TaxID=1287681 RepID=M7T105_EUTLA|nr:putative carbohydrate-binding wsc protein [Eutypa lata UCREL1]